MNWLLLLHIATLAFWVGFLLYLPLLLAAVPLAARGSSALTLERPEFARVVFTHFATPIALVTIIAGTLVFAWYQVIGPWLVAKLTFVVLLVANHILLGFLIIRAEAGRDRFLRPGCFLSLLATCLLATAVLWLVLAKPDFG